MGAPKCSDGVARKINTDGGAYNGGKDDGMKSSQLLTEEGNPTGEEEGVCNEHLGPVGVCDSLWRIKDENRWEMEVNEAYWAYLETLVAHRDKIQ